MTIPHSRGGFMLVMVLVITSIGLLFGAGALLMFKFQCYLRIDRQQELEKVYAVRSVLNYMRECSTEFAGDLDFNYHTLSGRDLGLIVRPVKDIFPITTNNHHFVMWRKGHLRTDFDNQYDPVLYYEYGVDNWEEIKIEPTHAKVGRGNTYGLAFSDLTATNNVRWWMNISLCDTGGWLQEDYGRRYIFRTSGFVDGSEKSKDVLRLCIIRNVTNELADVGRRHGWPLSQDGERAIVFQVTPRPGSTGDNAKNNNAEIMLFEYEYVAGEIVKTPLLAQPWYETPEECYMGIQLANDKVTAFRIPFDNVNIKDTGDLKLTTFGYEFSTCTNMTLDTYRYFAEDVWLGDIKYPGVTNILGVVQSPNLRAVFEVEAASDWRGEDSNIKEESNKDSNVDFITNFRVTPAYQYDIFLEHPQTVTNLATVAQKLGKYNRELDVSIPMIITYDTHGTEHKGFNRDERQHARELAMKKSKSEGGD